MIPDPLDRTVKIPIRIVNGYPCLHPEGRLPQLKDGTVGELTVSARAFDDPKVAARFAEERTESFLAAGVKLMAQVNPEHVPTQYREFIEPNLPGLGGSGVAFLLSENQLILRRGTKSAELLPCVCSIPALKQEAKSINHAYTLVSQAFEPHRISHAGNVFAKVYYRATHTRQPLKHLRGY